MDLDIGSRIYIDCQQVKGWAIIQYIFANEIFPIQVELEVPDADGHRIYRVSKAEIVQAQAVFKDSSAPTRYITKILIDHKTYSFEVGQEYYVGPTHHNRSTHYFVYNLDHSWKGCFPSEWFEIIKQYLKMPGKCQPIFPKVEPHEAAKNELQETIRYEQLTLF